MNNPLEKIKFKILKDYTTDDVFRETQKSMMKRLESYQIELINYQE